jgi:single-stranded-DNA-specific exonuclease
MNEASWRISPVDFGLARRLAAGLGVSHVLGEILARRGFTDVEAARAFLHPDFMFHSPYMLPGVAAARTRIDQALARNEPIVVYGDYDADGVTATFLLSEVLRELGADVSWRLPNRFDEGYGISLSAVEEVAADGARLIVTVDCGVNAVAEVERAQALGVDVIVTDHHELKGALPPCTVINPKLGGYPFAELAGVGVALKLAQGLLQEPGDEPTELPLALRPYVDVVAVGTVADIVPLRDENRSLVAMGLGRLRSAPRPGLAALLEVSGTAAGEATAGTIGFRLAPRLNAAGRLEDASLAMQLLGASDREQALPLALKLNELNQARQEIESTIFAEAMAMVADPPPAAIVLSSPDWHEGVVGIVASRLVERLNRPTILLSEGDGVAKGSGRSIPAFDLLAGVAASEHLLIGFGGHRAACGVRIANERIGEFRQRFTEHAAALLGPEDFVRPTKVDAVVCGDELTLALADELDLLAPHGFGNAKPAVLLHGAEIRSPRLTRDRRHMQSKVACDGASAAAIHFNFDALGELAPGSRYDIPLTLAKNSYNGAVSAQIEIKALVPLAAPSVDLCPTECAGDCRERLAGAVLLRHIEAASRLMADGGDEATAAVEQARRDGRLLDRRGRPLISTLAGLVATGERVLVLVADVARRRPLLSRDLLQAGFSGGALYLNAACLPLRLPLTLGASAGAPPAVVMASAESAALAPELVGAFRHVAFIDPPLSSAAFTAVVAAADKEAWVHVLWGEGEVHFAEQVVSAAFDLEARVRRLWRRVAGADGVDAGAALEMELAGDGRFLAELSALAAAWHTLDECGLLEREGGNNLIRVGRQKVDLDSSETYRTWRNKYKEKTFLALCRAARI